MSSNKPSEYITLISHDNYEFHLRRSAATSRSSTLRHMLNPHSRFSESLTSTCRLENISGAVLEKVVEYFYYAEKFAGAEGGVADMEMPADMCLELLMAADYLDA